MIAEVPEFPQILSDAEIDANVPVSEVVNQKNQQQPTAQELTDEAVAMLKSLLPRIHQNLVTLWGAGEGEPYLDGLIMDDRGNRQGFPQMSFAPCWSCSVFTSRRSAPSRRPIPGTSERNPERLCRRERAENETGTGGWPVAFPVCWHDRKRPSPAVALQCGTACH